MRRDRIIITGSGSLRPEFTRRTFGGKSLPVGTLPGDSESALSAFLDSRAALQELDRTSHLALFTAQAAKEQAGWKDLEEAGVNIGSSRGLTSSIENAYCKFESEGKVLPSTSPLTTSGNISSTILQSLSESSTGFSFSHSMTCSTALFALGNACAWMLSNMCPRFLVGGSEAPLTPFTLAQMQALGIYSRWSEDTTSPSRPLGNDEKFSRNSFVLGEGAAVFALEIASSVSQCKALAEICSFGYGSEKIKALTGISSEGHCFSQAMQMAMQRDTDDRPIDVILMHAPGTFQGDRAELKAILKTFPDSLPYLYSNKCTYGHTFGASGALSIITALELLHENDIPVFPYETILPLEALKKPQQKIQKIMINAAGFGGVAASVILSQYER